MKPGDWMDEHGCCKVCDGEIPHGHSAECYLWKLEQKLKEVEELHLLRLAAISTASLQNTPASVAQRIDKNNPYWTVAYADVCRAVDREMALAQNRVAEMPLRSDGKPYQPPFYWDKFDGVARDSENFALLDSLLVECVNAAVASGFIAKEKSP